MATDARHQTPGPAASLPRPVAVPLLLAGPALTVWFLAAHPEWFPAHGALATALAVALVFWSPLPFSVPAMVLQDARDAALPEARWLDRLTRPFKLLGHLACSPASSVRAESWAALFGLLAGALAMLAALA